jgi:protein-S-isoprenylcysteine O-methyltransferase Ste14
VALQFLLMGLAAAAYVLGPRWPGSVANALVVAGALLAVAGAALVVWSVRQLGKSLTPLPRPPRGSILVEGGPYRTVRHPVYTGVLAFTFGLALALSPLALVPAAALGALFGLKTRVEERFLREQFPGYAAYSERTRFRLLPYVY